VRDSALWWDGVTRVPSVPACVAAEGGPVWAPDCTGLTEAQVQEARAFGLSVLPWTVNQPADIARLIAWGADGLISDRPDLVLAMCHRDARSDEAVSPLGCTDRGIATPPGSAR